MVSAATSGYGCVLQVGDGGVGAGTQASKTVSTSDQQIIAKAQTAGTAGNSMQFGILVSGNNTAFSYTISATSLVITSATDGSGVATTTVEDAIVAIQDDATYRTYWELSTGAGNGSGILVASATSNLSGGANGAEVFTTIAEVKSISGPNLQAGIIDVTNMDSPNAVREFLPSLIDPGEVGFAVNFLPDNTTHDSIRTDLIARTKRNFKLQFTDSTPSTWSFAGYYTAFGVTAEIESVLQANVSIKLTSNPTES